MRRSRSTFAFAFLGLAALLYLTLLARPAALEDVYQNTKSSAQSLSIAELNAGSDKKEGEGAAGTEDVLKLPAPGSLDQLKAGGPEKLSEAPLGEENHLDFGSPPPSPPPPAALPPVAPPPAEKAPAEKAPAAIPPAAIPPAAIPPAAIPPAAIPPAAIPPAAIPPAAALPPAAPLPAAVLPPANKPESLPPTSAFENTKYPFQEDLDLPLPTVDLTKYKDNWPHNYNPSSPQQFAYATLLSTRNPSIRDPYFMALQNLIFRVLWSPPTRTLKYPFVVFVAPFVTEQQRSLISGAGAILRDLPPLEWDPPASSTDRPIYSRWKDNFSKLHMWNETDFTPAPRNCKSELLEADDYAPACGTAESPESYIFSAVPQGGSGPSVEVNVGAMVFSTSTNMYVRFLGNYQKYDRYVTHMADQGFMSWQFKQDGAFPATLLEREWDGFFPKEEDKGKLKVVHEKLWAADTKGWLKEEWLQGWKEMVKWYEGEGFVWERGNDNQLKELLRWSVGH
ncbi:hypothetical protein ACMFMG_011626 [Clarireedia jacksonii]